MNALTLIQATVEPGSAPAFADAWLEAVYDDAKERPHYDVSKELDVESVADINSVNDLRRLDPSGYQIAKTTVARTLASISRLIHKVAKRLSWTPDETVQAIMFYWVREDIVSGIQNNDGRHRNDHDLHNWLVDISNALRIVKLPDWDFENRKFSFHNYGAHKQRVVQATVEPSGAPVHISLTIDIIEATTTSKALDRKIKVLYEQIADKVEAIAKKFDDSATDVYNEWQDEYDFVSVLLNFNMDIQKSSIPTFVGLLRKTLEACSVTRHLVPESKWSTLVKALRTEKHVRI